MSGRRLKPMRQVRYAPTEDGAAVLGPSGALALRGSTVYAWLERLWPLLDGAQDVDAALDGLPGGHRAVATRLLDTLQRRGYLREATEARPHGLTATELHDYRHEIAYIGHWLDSPEHRFERYRTARVLLLGDGPLHAAARHALLACGLRHALGEDPGAGYEALRAAAEAADAVVYAGEGATAEAERRVAAAERACAGVPLFRALSLRGDCWLLPPTAPPGWADVRHRIRNAATPGPAGPLTAAAAALVGGRLALAVFRLLTGVPDEDAEAAGPLPETLRVDLATLATHRHRVLPAPRRPGAAPAPPDAERAGETADAEQADETAGVEQADETPDVERRMRALRASPALGPDELTARLADCADALTGPYAPPTTEYGNQIPLTVARCAVAGADPVAGASLDPRTARAMALRRAGASYGLVAARPAPPARDRHAAPAPAGFPAERLTDSHALRLPAALVLPGPAGGDRESGRPAAVGTACAESWDAAVEAALFDAVRSLAPRRATAAPHATPRPEGQPPPHSPPPHSPPPHSPPSEGLPAEGSPAAGLPPEGPLPEGPSPEGPPPTVLLPESPPPDSPLPEDPPSESPSPEAPPAEPEAARPWRLLCALGPAPGVWDLSGGLVVPVVGLVVEGRLVSVGCAATAAGALADAAGALLLARQQGTEPSVEARPAGPLAAPARAAGRAPASLPGAGPRERVAALAASLAGEGYTAYAVPLDHDTDFHALVPFIARVVLDEAR
ncbi:group-specific protein [Streptomyces sparsogenes]|uniref:group-specific protein n=1 Tax=Streptomyces sparsogenes TaxID=67365 RepID=UPI0033EC589F